MKQILKTKFNLRIVPLLMAAAIGLTSVTGTTAQAQSVGEVVKCSSISAFATTSAASLKISQQAMQATFDLVLNAKQTQWKVQDAAVSAYRQVSKDAFLFKLRVFKKTPLLNKVQKTAIGTYQDTLLQAVRVLETNVDAAVAAYREDMLALIKSHQAALTEIVQRLADKINAASDLAKKNCKEQGSIATLIATVASAKATLLLDIIQQDVLDFQKAVEIVNTRNSTILKQDVQFLKVAGDATIKLTKVILTGRE